MRKLTRVDFLLVCHLLKTAFSFSHEFLLKPIFGTLRGGGTGGVTADDSLGCCDGAPPIPSHQDSRASPQSSVPLSDQLQHLADGDGLT